MYFAQTIEFDLYLLFLYVGGDIYSDLGYEYSVSDGRTEECQTGMNIGWMEMMDGDGMGKNGVVNVGKMYIFMLCYAMFMYLIGIHHLLFTISLFFIGQFRGKIGF
ncbi:MAG: hypothetical protein QXF15_03790 [Candidatus Aenigmatarchaeota archaeon]